MKLIRAARVYRLDLPAAEVLANHLAELQHREIGETDFSTRGFVPPVDQHDLVLSYPGGYAFALRYDEKIVPASVTAAEAKKRIADLEAEYDTRLPQVDRQRVREEVFADLCRKALVRAAIVTCFYRTTDRLLIVPTASRKLADVVTSSLVQVVGSIKAQTIYVSNAKHGLTTRLRAYLNDEPDAFDGFNVGGTCRLKLPESRSMAVKMDDVADVAEGLVEAMARGGEVAEIGLSLGTVDFRLSSDFVIKGVSFADEVEQDEGGSAIDAWIQETAVRTLQFADAVNQLCDLLGYKEPKTDEPEATDDLI